MKLPQYRLLKISSDRKGTSIKAEWVDFVTCGECKHWNEEDHWCNIRDSYGWNYKPDDFCSYGEREGE